MPGRVALDRATRNAVATSFRGQFEWVRGEHVGQGGQGFAYWATRKDDGSTGWVLKTLRDSVPVDRFALEIDALRRLSSPRIPSVEDYSLESGQRFYVTAYRGKPLGELLTATSLTPRELLNLFDDIVQAVVDAHSVEVAHRDIKPNNVVVDETGRASLIDFGLCAIVDNELVSITPQEKYGNEAFAAPECLHGSPFACGMEADYLQSWEAALSSGLACSSRNSRSPILSEISSRFPTPCGGP